MTDCPFYRPHLKWCPACINGPCNVQGPGRLDDLDRHEFRSLVYLLDGFGSMSVVERRLQKREEKRTTNDRDFKQG